MNKTGIVYKLVFALSLTLAPIGVNAQSAVETASAEMTFRFIANTLQNFQRTGRLYDEIGIDGSEYEHFIQLLQNSYAAFSKDFAPDSEFCNFYRDPRNGIMEIEEKAMLAWQYLPGLDSRLRLYQRLDQQFLQDIQQSYGGRVLEKVNELRAELTSFELLPARDLAGAEIVNFADTACR